VAGDLDRETGEPAAIVWLPTTLFDVGSVGWQQDGAALGGASRYTAVRIEILRRCRTCS